MDRVSGSSPKIQQIGPVPSDLIESRLSEVQMAAFRLMAAVREEVVHNATQLAARRSGPPPIPMGMTELDDLRLWIKAQLSPWQEMEGDSERVQRAIYQMANAFVRGCRMVDLRGDGLVSALPGAIDCFAWLKELHLEGKKLSFLPSKIGALKGLQELSLFGGPFHTDRLISLLNELSHLRKLRVFCLAGSQLTFLPEEIGQLKSLEKLDLSENGLTSLPNSMGLLEHLRILTLQITGITHLPDTMAGLRRLEKVNLSFNQLRVLPGNVVNLRSLERLDLSYNDFTALPKEIERLTKLKKLKLQFNKLSLFPNNIVNLSSLEELDLSNNQLTAFPEEMGGLHSLKELYLNNNNLIAFPSALGRIESLKALDLSHNQIDYLPETIKEFQSLERFNLEDNLLTSLPHSIGYLDSLTAIKLAGNPLLSLPMSMGNLARMTLWSRPRQLPEEQASAIWAAQVEVKQGKKLEETKAYRWLLKRHPEEARTLSTLFVGLKEGEKIAYLEWLRRLAEEIGFTQAFQEIEASLLARWPSRATKAAASAQAVA